MKFKSRTIDLKTINKYLHLAPLVLLIVITGVSIFGIYWLNAYPNRSDRDVPVGETTVKNPYYTGNSDFPDLDNCPGGPYSNKCYDPAFGFEISCANSGQEDEDYNLEGDICDRCGNRVVDPGEECDIELPGSCPTSCSGSCETIINAGTCQAQCAPISTCSLTSDGCCPAGCAPGSDSDCITAVCNDGVVTSPEKCDTAIAAGQTGACPTDRVDDCPSTPPTGSTGSCYSIANAGACQAECVGITGVAACSLTSPTDGCCPAGCSISTDSDCTARCGDGTVTSPEVCEPPSANTAANAGSSASNQYGCCVANSTYECTRGGAGALSSDCGGWCGDGIKQSPPEGCDSATSSNLDIVFVFDTSTSMNQEVTYFCQAKNIVIQSLLDLNYFQNIIYDVYGIHDRDPSGDTRNIVNVTCRTGTGYVTTQYTGETTDEYEDWGPAIIDVTQKRSWTTGYQKVIIIFSDEAPQNGYNNTWDSADTNILGVVDGNTCNADTSAACSIAKNNSVKVFVVGTEGFYVGVTGHTPLQANINTVINFAEATGGDFVDANNSDTAASDIVCGISSILNSLACTPSCQLPPPACYSSCPAGTDQDGDLICNSQDNCRTVSNINQEDTDNDCPSSPYSSDPACGNACDTHEDNCTNLVSDDTDTDIDCADSDCTGNLSCIATITYWPDGDSDGYYSATSATCSSGPGCPPAGSSSTAPSAGNADCDDSNPNIKPGIANPYCDCNSATGGGVTAGTPETTVAFCSDSLDNDCDAGGSTGTGIDCADANCAGVGTLGTTICCQDVSNCTDALPTPNCATSQCNSSNICQFTAQNSLFDNGTAASCGVCNTTTFACQANTTPNFCGDCASCLGSGNNYNCTVPAGDPECGAVCSQCVVAGTSSSCQNITNGQDSNGPSASWCDSTNAPTGSPCDTSIPGGPPCRCDNIPQCVYCEDDDLDGSCNNNDPCPYDPTNDLDNNNYCAIGCTSHTGASRAVGTNKTNGFTCVSAGYLAVDPCPGDSTAPACSNSGSSYSCRAVFGGDDYLGIWVANSDHPEGQFLTGNFYAGRDPNINPNGKIFGRDNNDPYDQTFVVDQFFKDGEIDDEINVITFVVEEYTCLGYALRGAFANFDDTAMCSLINSGQYGKTERDTGTAFPLRAVSFNDNSSEPPLDGRGLNWKHLNYDDSFPSSPWITVTIDSAGNGVFGELNIEKYNYPDTIWPDPVGNCPPNHGRAFYRVKINL